MSMGGFERAEWSPCTACVMYFNCMRNIQMDHPVVEDGGEFGAYPRASLFGFVLGHNSIEEVLAQISFNNTE